jgi:epoxyqueuosine reductase
MNGTPEELVKQVALDVGFSVAGVARVDPHERTNRVFERWLAEGRHGEMAWLDRHAQKRADPGSLLPGAKSAICVGLNYYQEIEREQRLMNGSDGRGVFSIYVHGEDYHAVMDRMLNTLAARISEAFPGVRTFSCCDIHPISDRAMALRSGIAWLGKNTAAISPEYGSWIFLGELITTLRLRPDEPLETLCGSCTRCIDACPAGALDTPFVLDANKCISYLTIEKRGDIPSESHGPIGLDVYGCDTCQSVCPFNDAAEQSLVFHREHRSPLVDMTLDELVTIDDDEFREKTKGSAIRRCKPEGMRRNAAVVQENLRSGPLIQPAGRFQDKSGR